METNSGTQWGIIGVAVVILVVGGAWLVSRNHTAEPATGDNPLATTTVMTPTTTTTEGNNMPKGTQTATSDGESVAVADQAAGGTVEIKSMQLTRASWIAVRDDRSILGAKWFPANTTTGSMHLQRATEAGQTYHVVIYVDDGDKKFDYKKDQLISSNGAAVGTSFKTN